MDPIALCNLLLYARPETRLQIVRQLVADGDQRVWAMLVDTTHSSGPWLLRARCLEALGLAAGVGDQGLAETILESLARGQMLPRPEHAPEVQLTARQRHVARLIAEGLSNREIGRRLGIATGTVGVHVQHLLDRLGVPTRAAVGARVGERPEVFRDRA